MREKAVCNTSPLIFLAKIQRLAVLDNYELLIPSQVAAEIVKGLNKKKQDAKKIIGYLENNHINPKNAFR